MKQTTRIIAIAGTKGKTTCVRALHYAINAVHDEAVLGVDTHRIMLGGDPLMSKEDFTDLFGLGTAVAPGKALLALRGQKKPIAVLEASVGVHDKGLAYFSHEIGIFTNVFDDHIKQEGKITSRRELANAKASFILHKIAASGTAIYNADNDMIAEQLCQIPSDDVIRVACTLGKSRDFEADYIATIQDNKIVILSDGRESMSVDIETMPWLYQGKHQPSLYNGMFILSALWRFYKDEPAQLQRAINALTGYIPDLNGARMVIREAANGTKVIIDFAHERESLKQIAEFARNSIPADGRVIGVLRMNNARGDDHIKRSADYFVGFYDKLFIYDMASKDGDKGRKVGDVPNIIAESARANNVPVEVITDHREALNAARQEALEGDAVVYIVHNHLNALAVVDDIFHVKGA